MEDGGRSLTFAKVTNPISSMRRLIYHALLTHRIKVTTVGS